jgi:hypothetical protein
MIPPLGTAKPTQADVLRAQQQGVLASLDVILPGEVVTYDAATQTASVKVAIKGGYKGKDGQPVYEDRPVLAGVPVCFPVGDNTSITWKLTAGSRVLILCGSRSLDEWKANGTSGLVARDTRRHQLQDAFCLPQLPCPVDPIPSEGVDPDAMVIRAPMLKLGDGGASDFVALAPAVMDYLSAMTTYLSAIAAATLVSNPTDPTALAWVAAAAGFPGDVAATKVKAI